MANADLKIPIDRIKPDPDNVRRRVSVPEVKALAASIKALDLLNPIIVRPYEGAYMVVAGHRRLAAIGLLVEAGEHDGQVPVIIRAEDISAARVTIEQLVENLQREDIDILDEAAGYMRLLEFEMSQADIARMVGRSRAHVTKRLALLSLPAKAKEKLSKGDITIETALAIAALSPEHQAQVVEEGRWDQFTIARLLRTEKGQAEADRLTAELTAIGVEVRKISGTVAEEPASEGKRWETIEVVHSDTWNAEVPENCTMASIDVTGEVASIRFYQEVDATKVDKAKERETERERIEKERKKAIRLEEQAKRDFLINALGKVKASDAADMAFSLALGRATYGNAKDICILLDLDVPSKETTTYDGKTRQEKQYYPKLMTEIREAREAGDIGFLRRVVLAIAVTVGQENEVLALYGYNDQADVDVA